MLKTLSELLNLLSTGNSSLLMLFTCKIDHFCLIFIQIEIYCNLYKNGKGLSYHFAGIEIV